MVMMRSKSDVSLPKNIFFFNSSIGGGGSGGAEADGCAENNAPCLGTRRCKETRQLLADTDHNKNFYGGMTDKQISLSHQPSGIKDVLSSKANRKISNVTSSSISIGSKCKRLVSKDGIVDIKYINVPGISKRYLSDLFHTLIDAKWRYISVLFTLSFIVSWLIFGTSWWAIVKFNTGNKCVDKVDDWINAFLFSIETQTTIGFGGRAVTSNCPEAVLLLVVQTIVGMFINCAMLGLLFAKLARPKNRGKATMFSKKAVVTIREGNYCLIFRYVDFRHRRLLDSNIRLVIVRQKLTEEGEFIPLDMADLKVTIDFMQQEYALRVFPLFPVTIIHVIDDQSPLFQLSRFQLENAEFEIIPILEGTVPTTGSTTQALTSYKPNEILWGHRFKPVFNGLHIGQAVNRIDLSTLHDTYEEKHTPECSAEEYQKTNKDNDDFSSFSGSHGYQSGTRSSYSMDHRAMSRLDLNTSSKRGSATGSDIVIDVDSEEIQNIAQLKESDA